jgi:hypothetical protein
MEDGSNALWDYVTENQKVLETKFNDCVQIMYMTKRSRYRDTNLFLHAESPDCFGDFVARIIAPIPGVNGLWLFHLHNMRFFRCKEELFEDRKRYIVTISAYPARFEEIYHEVTKLKPGSGIHPVYLAYTFHLFTDSILFSFLAGNEEAAKKFVAANIRSLPGVLNTTMNEPSRQQRITSPQEWKLYVKSNLLPGQ